MLEVPPFAAAAAREEAEEAAEHHHPRHSDDHIAGFMNYMRRSVRLTAMSASLLESVITFMAMCTSCGGCGGAEASLPLHTLLSADVGGDEVSLE